MVCDLTPSEAAGEIRCRQGTAGAVRDGKSGPEPALALIAARPGRMRDSLQALLAARFRTDAVDVADDSPAALRRVAAASRPALLVLDTSLPGGAAWSLLK